MKEKRYLILILALLGAVAASVVFLLSTQDQERGVDNRTVRSSVYPELSGMVAGLPKPIGHDFFRSRDPKTGAIPEGIRRNELQHAKTLSKRRTASLINWVEAGPDSLGGRVLSVALDVADTTIVLAGAASGGVWKSDDEGDTWRNVTRPNEQFSVTTLAQDVRPGETNVWYLAGGEFRGTSGSHQNISTNYALGVYKSVDNGESWDLLAGASAGDPAVFDSGFDYVSDIEISPVTGTVFLANNASGIYRSDDGGLSFPLVLGTTSAHAYTSVDVGSDGRIIATLSTLALGGGTSSGGVFISEDDGLNWTNITPSTFPSSHQRSLVEVAPSNPDVAYVFTVVNRPTPGPWSKISAFISWIC